MAAAPGSGSESGRSRYPSPCLFVSSTIGCDDAAVEMITGGGPGSTWSIKPLGIDPRTEALCVCPWHPPRESAGRESRRRRRNRPPETLRHKGPRRVGDLWKAGRRASVARTDGVRGTCPNLSGTVTEGGQLGQHAAGRGALYAETFVAQNALPDDPTPIALNTVRLDAWHRRHGARMV